MENKNKKKEKKLSNKELLNMKNELEKKDKEFDLQIKGLKEKIVQEKKLKGKLEKEVFQLEGEVKLIQIKIDKEESKNENDLNKVQSDYDFENGLKVINNQEYHEQITQEEKKQNDLIKLIEKTKREIEQYEILLQNIKNEENGDVKELKRINEDMENFLSNL